MNQTPIDSKDKAMTSNWTLWIFRHLKLVTSSVAFMMLLLGVLILFFAWHVEQTHPFVKDSLVNIASGFFEIGIGTILGVALTLLVTKAKFEELARPTLSLIQRLRITGTLKDEAARNSVVFA